MPPKKQPVRKNGKQTNTASPPQRIIVIGASAGGFEAFKKIVKGLPAQFNASIFIVWHISPDVPGILPQVLSGLNNIPAAHAFDGEEIKPGRIYVAPPDKHLLIEDERVRVTRGPKENCFRPAIDPLFRSAAYTYGKRVIGVILSGGMDDGTAGLWTVKQNGGIAIVQDPADAEVPSMPDSARRHVKVDHCVPVPEIAGLLVRLSEQPLPKENTTQMKDDQTRKEIEIAAEENALEKGFVSVGELTPFTCPECHGVLSKLQNGNIVRYRCHTGHAFSADILLKALTEKIEDSIYNAIRAIDESIMMLNHLGDHFADANQPRLAAIYFKKAKDAKERSEIIRKAALLHERINKEALRKEAENEFERIP
jgi:two-component system chemotaxis response regulator CheB